MRIEIDNRHKWVEYATAALKHLQEERALRVARRNKEQAERNWFQRVFSDDSIQKLITWEIENWAQDDIEACERVIDACSRSDTGQVFLNGEEYDMIMYWKEPAPAKSA